MIKHFFSKKTAFKEKPTQANLVAEFSVADTFQKAMEHHQMGDFSEAETLYRQILQQQPDHFNALHYLGGLAYQAGQYETAIELISKAISLNANCAKMYFYLGLALQAVDKLTAAVENYQKALLLQFDYADAHYALGNALQAQGKLNDAVNSYHNALSFQPDYVNAYYNLGNVLLSQNKIEAALEMYRHVVFFKPDSVMEVNNNLARLLKEQSNLNEAIESYQCQLVLDGDNAIEYFKLGIMCYNLNRLDAAIKCFRGVISLKPDYADAYYNLGGLLQVSGKQDEAIEHYQKTLSLQPNHVEAMDMWFNLQLCCCDWSNYINSCKKVISSVKSEKEGNKPFRFLAISSSAFEQKQCAVSFNKQYLLSETSLWTHQHQHNKIRIAYVSGDFREHAVSFLMAGLFELHDNNRFEIIAISLQPEQNSFMGQRVKSAFSQFIDVSHNSDYEVAMLMRDLKIDIAVDLMGFTGECRSGIFAYRPAPIQVNYLGYPATMGANYIDYIIADSYLIPTQSQKFYTENIVYLPDCFQVNDHKRVISKEKPTRIEVGLPQSGFVFCSFNNSYKITPIFFDVWMRLLKSIPNSVLWLVADNPTVPDNLRSEAIKRGVNPERLIFASRLHYPDHLARLQLADLFLDTLPFNAGTTASDSLWVGVPVLTCSGEAFSARMAGSLLNAIGLPELITNNIEQYESLAFKLATTPKLLSKIRDQLVKNRNTSPLFNTNRFCHHIETAYMKMWERYQGGELPVSFAVQPVESPHD